MSTSVTTGTVVAEGADIYFERRGSGPALLLISGGGGDAGNYSDLADSLADEYTVLTYDRRGNSRSRLRADPTKLRVEEQSADARAVLDHNGIGSASVFGSSSGAVIGLDLAARSRTPLSCWWLTSRRSSAFWTTPIDGLPSSASSTDPRRRGCRTGVDEVHVQCWARENEPRAPELMQRLAGNWEFFARYEMRPVAEFVPDLEALRESKVPLVFAGGHESRSYYYCRAGEASLLALASSSSSFLATTWRTWTMRTALRRSCGRS